MSGLDGFLAVVLAFGVWRGLRSGALLQIVGTAGWVLGFVVATALMGPVGEIVAASLGVSPRTAPVLGFIVLFGVVVAGLTAAAHALRKTLRSVRLGGFDTLAGAGVGGLRSAFGLSVLLLATAVAPVPGSGPLLISEEAREASVLYSPIEAIAPVVWDGVREASPGIQDAVVRKFHAWRERGEEPDPDAEPGIEASAEP